MSYFVLGCGRLEKAECKPIFVKNKQKKEVQADALKVLVREEVIDLHSGRGEENDRSSFVKLVEALEGI